MGCKCCDVSMPCVENGNYAMWFSPLKAMNYSPIEPCSHAIRIISSSFSFSTRTFNRRRNRSTIKWIIWNTRLWNWFFSLCIEEGRESSFWSSCHWSVLFSFSLTTDLVPKIYFTAYQLRIEALVKACSLYLSEQLTEQNCLSMLWFMRIGSHQNRHCQGDWLSAFISCCSKHAWFLRQRSSVWEGERFDLDRAAFDRVKHHRRVLMPIFCRASIV